MKIKGILPSLKNFSPICLLAVLVLAGSGGAQAADYIFRTTVPGSIISSCANSGKFQQSGPGTYSVTIRYPGSRKRTP